MFNQKQKSLWPTKETQKSQGTVSTSTFVQEGLKQSAKTHSSDGMGDVKYKTTGNDFLDQFGSTSQYRKHRSYADIERDCITLWNQNPKLSVIFILFIRTITRVTNLFNVKDKESTDKVQKGGGLRYEAIMRMIWLNINHPEAFWKNIHLFISVGSWRDIFAMMRYDLVYHGWDKRVLNWDRLREYIIFGLTVEGQAQLIKKYMPTQKARSKCKTPESQANCEIAKYLAKGLNMNYEQYRKVKRTGTAHQWQQVISKKDFDALDFDTIHGKALMLLTKGKFIDNQKMKDRFEKWILSKPVAKFTGFVYELYKAVKEANRDRIKEITFDKQYLTLLERAKEDENITRFIVCRDVSGSMGSGVQGINMSAYDFAASLSILFSDIMEGPFKNIEYTFQNRAEMRKINGSSFSEKVKNTQVGWAGGGTDPLAVAHEIVRIYRTGVGLDQLPEGILCISDGEFNRGSGLNTTVNQFRQVLKAISPEYANQFKFAFWDVTNWYYTNNTTKFETYGDHENVFYLSGFDGTLVNFLFPQEIVDAVTGEKKVIQPKSAEELMEAALSQEVHQLVEV